jgi:hypothetical protein
LNNPLFGGHLRLIAVRLEPEDFYKKVPCMVSLLGLDLCCNVDSVFPQQWAEIDVSNAQLVPRFLGCQRLVIVHEVELQSLPITGKKQI